MVTSKHEDKPVFGKNKEILFYYKEDVCFLLVFRADVEFCPHYHAYDTYITPHTFITTVENLLEPHPVNAHRSFDICMSRRTFVTLKFNVL